MIKKAESVAGSVRRLNRYTTKQCGSGQGAVSSWCFQASGAQPPLEFAADFKDGLRRFGQAGGPDDMRDDARPAAEDDDYPVGLRLMAAEKGGSLVGDIQKRHPVEITQFGHRLGVKIGHKFSVEVLPARGFSSLWF